MINSTPMKLIQKNLFSSKMSLASNPNALKQFTSQQLKAQYLQTKLVQKNKKLSGYQEKNQELIDKLAKLQHKMSVKQLEICTKDSIIQNQQNKIKNLQSQIVKLVQQINGYKKQQTQLQIQEIKQKKQQQYYEKLNKVLTKQNAELIAERLEFKRIIQQHQANIDELGDMLHLQKENGQLINKLNQQLQLQVQELIFELRMINRREQTNKLSQYESLIDSNKIKRQNKIKIKKKCLKQNIDINNSQIQQQNLEENQQLVQLLKQKIINLQEHLSVSERRCKQLQTIILSK